MTSATMAEPGPGAIRFDYSSGQAPKLAIIGRDEASAAESVIGEVSGVKCYRHHITFPSKTRLFELVMQELSTGGIHLDVDVRVAQWYSKEVHREVARAELSTFEDIDIRHVNASRLWAFQRVAANFIAKLGTSMICDQCGLGKTATSIVGVELARHHRKVLIICPNSLKRWWEAEIPKWSGYNKPIIVVDSKDRSSALADYKQGWLIINYEQIFRAPQLKDMLFDWLICDESQRLKNRKTKTWKAVRKIRYRRAVMLTGTPYGNAPAELWAPLSILDPQRYRSYWRFYEMYTRYKEDFWGSREILGVKNPEILRRELATIMIRRTKEEVLTELPPKIYQTIPLEVTGAQRDMYRRAAREYLIELEDQDDIEIPNVVAMIVRLRQILSSPSAFDIFDIPSCKVTAAMDYIESTQDKVVVFSQFRATIEELHRLLNEKGIYNVYIMGGMDVAKAVDTFQTDPECRVFLGTAATGGVGITLTASSTIVFIDKHWNPAQQEQAEDRVHRIGQAQPVHIVSLVCPGSVDDLVERALERKLSMISAVLGKALTESLKEWV